MTFNGKKSQVEVTFNWVYILIAGAVILLFFVGIVAKQKKVSDENLSIEVGQILSSILQGASVSEKTRSYIQLEGLADRTFFFNCEEGMTKFGLVDSPRWESNSIVPLFAPVEIQTATLVLWSLPYFLPYKVMDFLFVTSVNTKYFLAGNGNGFAEEFFNAVEEDQSKFKLNVVSLREDPNPGKNFQVRVVYLDELEELPSSFVNLADERVTAVHLDDKKAIYYQKEGSEWRKTGETEILSLDEERDAAKYAAIFAADAEQYECNMQKAFLRLKLVTEIYTKKTELLGNYYEEQKNVNPDYGTCLEYVRGFGNQENLRGKVASIKNHLGCLEINNCGRLTNAAQELRDFNRDMERSALHVCAKLY